MQLQDIDVAHTVDNIQKLKTKIKNQWLKVRVFISSWSWKVYVETCKLEVRKLNRCYFEIEFGSCILTKYEWMSVHGVSYIMYHLRQAGDEKQVKEALIFAKQTDYKAHKDSAERWMLMFFVVGLLSIGYTFEKNIEIFVYLFELVSLLAAGIGFSSKSYA